MKKILAIVLAVTIAASAVGCGGPVPVMMKNGYTIHKNKIAKWFDVSAKELLKSINEKAEKDGKEQFQITNSGYGTKTYPDILDIKIGEGMFQYTGQANKVVKVELEMDARDTDRAAANGYYAELLFDLFNPGMKDQIAERLYLYKDLPEGKEWVELTCGNVVYFYNGPGDNSRLSIYPNEDIAELVDEDEAISPIKPK